MPIAAPDMRISYEAQAENRARPEGLTRGQGRLILLLLAANLIVLLAGGEGALTGLTTLEQDGGNYSLGMRVLVALGWTLIIGGGALMTGGAAVAALVWWSRRQVGRLSRG